VSSLDRKGLNVSFLTGVRYFISKRIIRMTVGRHGRLTYKKGTVDLSELLDEQSVPRSAGGKESMPVTGKLGSLLLRM